MEYSGLERSHILCIECLPQTNIMRLSLFSSQKEDAEHIVDFDIKASHQCVDEVMQLLRDQSIDARQIAGIGVVQGAQRFTIARMIAVTANALSVALDIPVRDYTDAGQLPSPVVLWKDVNSAASHTSIHPRYTAEPRITMKKVL